MHIHIPFLVCCQRNRGRDMFWVHSGYQKANHEVYTHLYKSGSFLIFCLGLEITRGVVVTQDYNSFCDLDLAQSEYLKSSTIRAYKEPHNVFHNTKQPTYKHTSLCDCEVWSPPQVTVSNTVHYALSGKIKLNDCSRSAQSWYCCTELNITVCEPVAGTEQCITTVNQHLAPTKPDHPNRAHYTSPCVRTVGSAVQDLVH